jgi:hypothetical protein
MGRSSTRVIRGSVSPSAKSDTRLPKPFRRPPRGESGAILILALVYIVSVSLIVLALATWASNDLKNTTRFNSGILLHSATSGVVNTAIQSIRYVNLGTNNASSGTGSLGECWLPTTGNVSQLPLDGYSVDVWCQTQWSFKNAIPNYTNATRVTTFYACLGNLPASNSLATDNALGANCVTNGPLLTAVVSYDDYPPGSNPILTAQCTLYCGQGATLDSWIWS